MRLTALYMSELLLHVSKLLLHAWTPLHLLCGCSRRPSVCTSLRCGWLVFLPEDAPNLGLVAVGRLIASAQHTYACSTLMHQDYSMLRYLRVPGFCTHFMASSSKHCTSPISSAVALCRHCCQWWVRGEFAAPPQTMRQGGFLFNAFSRRLMTNDHNWHGLLVARLGT